VERFGEAVLVLGAPTTGDRACATTADAAPGVGDLSFDLGEPRDETVALPNKLRDRALTTGDFGLKVGDRESAK
jgi:hypothetical protein